MIKADYIITGAGASGLMLAYRLAQDAFFDNTTILIIDNVKNKGNDRTWCYWENGIGEWDQLVSKQWTKIFFGSAKYSATKTIAPYSYKMIRSEAFYNSLWKAIQLKPNITFIEDTVTHFSEHDAAVTVQGKKNTYTGNVLFNSLLINTPYSSQKKYPVIQQHFVGWFIKTKTECFDASTATFMDFKLPQNGNTRFMYVLPINKTTALFEYTLFSKDLLDFETYENAIKTYLKNLGITDYIILEKEQGSIPMTSYKFTKLNTKHIINIGTAGGWTKASTGYTFKTTSKKTKQIVKQLKQETDLLKFNKTTKFWYYDVLFLDVLANYNKEGSKLFASLFKNANTTTIFKFLDEESTLLEDLKIITAVPPKRFTQALLKRLFKS